MIATQILEQKSLCQQDPDEDGDADAFAEEQAEFEGVLISTATDLVAALASVLGPDFVESFGKFRPLVSKYYVSARAFEVYCSHVDIFVSPVTHPHCQ